MLKLKEKLQQVSDAAQNLAADKLTDKVPDEVQAERWKICEGCDKLYVPTSTCKICGCFMKLKTWMPNQKCPADKWGRYTDTNTNHK